LYVAAIATATNPGSTTPGQQLDDAFPGHTQQEIGSGTGVVHNAFLLQHVQKSVTEIPFRPSPHHHQGRVDDVAEAGLLRHEQDR
jgi:hypothetical protein